MSAEPEGGATLCAICGREWRESDNDREQWLSIEITRADADGNAEWINDDFCSQAHAAQWLSRPLPPPAEPELFTPVPSSPKERFLAVAAALCVIWALGLMALGAYALVRLLGGWD